MNTSSDETANRGVSLPVSTFFYRDMDCARKKNEQADSAEPRPAVAIEHEAAAPKSAEDVDAIVKCAVSEAVADTERRLVDEYEARAMTEAAKIVQALELFQEEQKNYFSRVEAEVVHLALAISSKILHRETQLDPQLLAALVRIAIEKLHDGSSVSVRVAPPEANKWTEYMSARVSASSVMIVADSNLELNECILETDMGSADFSIDAQLKEIEKGFFDLLAQRPAGR